MIIILMKINRAYLKIISVDALNGGLCENE